MSKTATDVIKGLRKGKIDRTAFLTTVYSEIREEVKSPDLAVKTNAIRKLFILALEGYDMEWASFHILEVMSSTKFSQKHSGLLAASQCFKPNSDILFLATNFFRRELVASNHLDTCVAINCLACIVNSDMSKELMNDCVTLLNASKVILRKKVSVLFFKLFVQFPEGLTVSFTRLCEKLKDENNGVVMGTVNTIYELARYNPSFVLSTAKELYELLNTTSNNWLLIKLIKLFTELAKVEPRLIRRLNAPFIRILQNNPAKSVEFEVIRSIAIFHESEEIIRLALSKLHGFLDSHDPNCKTYIVKYLGLVALHQLIQICPNITEEYRIFVLEALQSKDITIRLRALGLLKIITTPGTLVDTITNLLAEIEKPGNSNIKEDLVSCALYLLTLNQYELVEDFRWMFEVLVKVVTLKTVFHEAQLSSVMLDVVLRVEELRAEACEISLDTLEKFDTLKSDKCEALTALLFILGEFCNYMRPELQEKALNLLAKPRWNLISFHESVYNALSSSIFKVALRLNEHSLFETCVQKLKETSSQIDHMEAQERSLMYINIIVNTKKDNINIILNPFLPIHPSAQSLISLPEELTKPFTVNNEELVTTKSDGSLEYHYFRDEDFGEVVSEEQKANAKQKIKEKQMLDPFYINSKKKGKKKKGKKPKTTEETVPIEEPEEKKPEVHKKYSVNKAEPLLPS